MTIPVLYKETTETETRQTYKHLIIQGVENPSEEFLQQAKNLDLLLSVVSICLAWARQNKSLSLQKPNQQLQSLLKLSEEQPNIRLIVSQAGCLLDPTTQEDQEVTNLINKVEGKCFSYFTHTLDSEIDLQLTLDSFKGIILHDLRNKITPFTVLQAFKRSFDKGQLTPDRIQALVVNLDQLFIGLETFTSQSVPDILAQNPPGEKITIGEWQGLFQKYLKSFDFSVNIKELDPQIEKFATLYTKSLIEPLIENFALNTIKACTLRGNPSLTPEISVSFTKEASYLLITIENNGIYFEPALLESGFKEGYSGFKNKGQGKVSGTGIGMAAHRKMIEHFKGYIKLENKTDQIGTRTIIHLPLIS